MQIFLYTPEAEIPSAQLEALKRKGFIPVKVRRLCDVQILTPPVEISALHMDALALAGMRAVANSGLPTVGLEYVKELNNIVNATALRALVVQGEVGE